MLNKLFKPLHILIGIILILIWIYDLINNQSIVNFLSYFTVENILLFAITSIAYGISNRNNSFIDSLRGAVTVYIIVVGAGFVLLVEKTQGPLVLPWVNTLYHKIMPFVVVLDWITFTPSFKLNYKQAAYWQIFPLLFGIYTLVRGYFTNWYPYDFVNPIKHGYQAVFTNFFVFLIFLFLTSFVIIFIGNKCREIFDRKK